MEQSEAALAALLSGLVASPEPDAVARWIARGTLRAWGCTIVLLHSSAPDAVRLLASHGLTPTQTRRLRHIDPATALPQSEVVRSGLAHSCAGAHLVVEYPLMAGAGLPATGYYEFLPIRRDTVTVGVLSARLDAAPDALFRQAFSASADAVALWLGTRTPPTPAVTLGAPLRLSERQQRVLAGLRRGRTNAAIAAELGFALGTIKADIAAMSQMLGAHGRAELIERAARAGY